MKRQWTYQALFLATCFWAITACSGADDKKSVDTADSSAADLLQQADSAEDLEADPDMGDPLEVADDALQETAADLGEDLKDPPDNCCLEAADCDQGFVCVGAQQGDVPKAGSCQPEPDSGECWSDDDCNSVEDWCEGQVICGCGEKCMLGTGHCIHTDPPFCCESDEQCFGDESCVGETQTFEGLCMADPGGNACWGDAHCEPEGSCLGASVPSCWSDAQQKMGTCSTMPDYCCLSNNDCEAGHTCTAADGPEEPGTCELDAPPGECWSNADCNDKEYCHGANTCPCFMDCFTVNTGQCKPVTVDCCLSDDECQAGQQCIKESQNGPGICKDQPGNGLCWHDLHCKPDQVCQGAEVCPCDADCDGADMEGECAKPCDEDDCCCLDSDCPQDYVCAENDQGNSCMPPMGEGMCWQDKDCPDNHFCHGANTCPCNWDCDGDGWDIPGTCKTTGGDMCCFTAADCPQYFMGAPMVCVIQEGNPDVVGVCQTAPDPGRCWDDSDCYMEQVCKDIYFCSCGMDCGYPGLQAGTCSPLPQGCCYDDSGCGEGFVCKGFVPGDNMPGHCLPHPDGPACPFDAQCCWNDADCSGESTCKDSYFCGCIELCPVCGDCAEDQIGTCQ